MGEEAVAGSVSSSLNLITDSALRPEPALWLLCGFSTGILVIDEQLQQELARIHGTLREFRLDITRAIGGGRRLNQSVRIGIEVGNAVASSAATFEVPNGYVFQEPQYGLPH